jgi:hypothetical protein
VSRVLSVRRILTQSAPHTMVDTSHDGPLQTPALHRTAHPDAFGVPELKHSVMIAVVTVASWTALSPSVLAAR